MQNAREFEIPTLEIFKKSCAQGTQRNENLCKCDMMM
jgi:hypothetical protein